jgi:3-oxoacyl-[acyl-carrier protein] reductase
MDLGLQGKIALVCGGSSGLGYAIAKRLLTEGARVAINGRDAAKVEAAVRSLEGTRPAESPSRRAAEPPSRRVAGYPADVSKPSDAAALVSRVHAELGGLDILLCNSGGPPAGPFEAHTAEAWQSALETNLLSAVHLCRAALPLMRLHGWGRILCLTSTAAKQPTSSLILSTTARAGVLGFAKALSDEVAALGITVNVLCPGYFGTDRLHQLAATRAAGTGRTADQVLSDMAAALPIRRIGTPDEFAAVAVFLASDAARYVTGTALSVDGGLTRSIL